MSICEAAKEFAINAHKGQVRRCEPDKPVVIHPIGVAQLLKKYGFDDHVVAAGYLHDIVEDTSYSIEDIKNAFGIDVANLVDTATEPNPNDSWEERKSHTIRTIRDLPIRNKAVICADKINNLESLKILFAKNGYKDFSAFKRGEKAQKWYYTEVYKSLINDSDPSLPMFQDLKDAIDTVFNGKDNDYLKNIIFINNGDYYTKLKQLDAQITELKQLKSIVSSEKPFVVEFTGTPRTGKTTIINSLYDFFKKGGFNISLVEEFISSKYYKDNIKKILENYSIEDRNIAILEYVYKALDLESKKSNDIILFDRSVDDRIVWNNIRYTKNEMTEETYYKMLEKYGPLAAKLIDFLVITYAEPITALRRDYNSSLSLEPRGFLNEDNLKDFNSSLLKLKPEFEHNIANTLFINTNRLNTRDTATKVAEDIMPVIRTRYLDSFKSKY